MTSSADCRNKNELAMSVANQIEAVRWRMATSSYIMSGQFIRLAVEMVRLAIETGGSVYRSLLLSVFLLTRAVDASAAVRDDKPVDCKLKRYASIDLTVGVNGRLLVPVTIENSDAMMVLDTGTAFSSVWQDAAVRLGLHPIPFPKGTADIHFGSIQVDQHAESRGFLLGSLKFAAIDFLVLPESSRAIFGMPATIVGIIGMDVFSKVDVELDIAHSQLNLYSQDHCPGNVVYWTDTYASVPMKRGLAGNFSFPLELNGKKIEATISTGNLQTTLSADVERKLFKDASDPSADGDDTGGSGVAGGSYRLMQITANGLKVINAQVVLVDSKGPDCKLTTIDGASAYTGCFGAYPLKLGFSVLSNLHLYLATKERVLYFTAATTDK
jgi:predicted aspartyl protease